MTEAIFYTAYDDMPSATVRLRRGRRPRRRSGGVGVLTVLAAGLSVLSAMPAAGPGQAHGPIDVAAALPVPQRVADDPLLLQRFVGGLPLAFTESRPVSARFVAFEAPALAVVAEAAAPVVGNAPAAVLAEPAVPGPQRFAANDAEADAASVVPALPPPASPLLAADVPLPTPRPSDVAPTVTRAPPFRSPRRPVVLASLTPPAKPTVAPDNRSFLQKFFGMGQGDATATAPALGYAAPEDSWFSGLRSGAGGNPARSYGEGTAVYEISSHTVFMPDGTRLEAHSGLGARLDDPRFVHERMRGPTPPATYALKLRESLFHGVQALRLTPVGSGVFGRDGLLAHTYMLGPKGDSNGCVSFRNYGSFLQAFRNGDVRRLVVVARLI